MVNVYVIEMAHELSGWWALQSRTCNTSLIMVKTISGVLAEFTILRYHDVSKIIESQYTVEATIYLMLTWYKIKCWCDNSSYN